MKKIVIFGAGNIGRSLVGYLFSRAGYEVVFIDIDDRLVKALNEKRKYRIEIRGDNPETIWVENVSAIHGRDVEKIAEEIASADILATAVGANNLKHIYGNIAKGLIKRLKMGKGPIDILICENLRDSSKIFREGLKKHLPADYPLDTMVGLVETCTGKMVPIMTEEQRRKDPLLILAEAYSKLIVDKKAFKGELPKVDGIEFVDNIKAYIDRKLFVHNLAHASTAYLAYITDPNMKYVWEALSRDDIRWAVKSAMWESGNALIKEYPKEFNRENMTKYIEDLIPRIANKALGDTLYRLGRDIQRKISRNDRLVGALLLDFKHHIPAPSTTLNIAAAILYRGRDEKGRLYDRDEVFVKEIYPRGIDYILTNVCGLDPEKERELIKEIKDAYEFISKNPKEWLTWLKDHMPS